MAACWRSAQFIQKRLHFSGILTSVSNPQSSYCGVIGAFTQVTFVRKGSFFNKQDAEALWDSLTTVSASGIKRGRGIGRNQTRRGDFNVGQMIGQGKSGIVLPGLNARVFDNKKLVKMHKGDGPRNIREKIMASREKRVKPVRRQTAVLQRGYAGKRLPGCHIGPPDPIEGCTFEGFDSIVLESKKVANVTASQGKVVSSSVLVVTGNKNGLAGFSLAKASDGKAALRNAKNKAAQRLVYFDRFEGHTLWHNFHEISHRTKLTAFKKHKGYGVVSHRVLKSVCELFGIKDIYIKAEGNSRNPVSLTRALFAGIQNQRTHQELADDLGHHIVEYRGEKPFPVVKASPSESANRDFVKSYDFDFNTYFFGGKIPLQKKKQPFYHKFRSTKAKQARIYKFRNQVGAKQKRIVMGIDGVTDLKLQQT